MFRSACVGPGPAVLSVVAAALAAFAAAPEAMAASPRAGIVQGVAVGASGQAGATNDAGARGSHRRQRELKRRQLGITDASVEGVSEIHVAGGVPTTLSFEVPVKDTGVILTDLKGFFFVPQLMEKAVLLVPKADLPRGESTTLTVALADGTLLLFKLLSVPLGPGADVDVGVDISVHLDKRATPESAAGLKEQLESVRSELDECHAGAAGVGAAKVAALLINQDMEKPQAFTVERHAVRKLDKQSRLLVQARMVYRLLDYSYLVVTVENRDPSRSWVLDRAELSLAGGDAAQEVKVSHVEVERTSLPPGEVEKLVLSFKTPEATVQHSYVVSLVEKNGNRHVKLEDVNL